MPDPANTNSAVDRSNGLGVHLLTTANGMGFTVCHTVVRAGTTSFLEYRAHLEYCYCLAGSEEIEDMPRFGAPDRNRHTSRPCARHLYDSLCTALHSAGIDRRALTAVEAATVDRDRAYLARLCVRAVHRLVRLAFRPLRLRRLCGLGLGLRRAAPGPKPVVSVVRSGFGTSAMS